MAFNKNVFVNCPFDKKFLPLLRAILFTTIYLDLSPRLSGLKSSDSVRIAEIMKLIKGSKYSIHDLSRCKPLKLKDLPRFNMPYELGLDIGCKTFGRNGQKGKKMLILESSQYLIKKVLSDIGGQDIASHSDEPRIVIEKIRNWINENSSKKTPGPFVIWNKFNLFNSHVQIKTTGNYSKGIVKSLDLISINDYIKSAKEWVKTNRQH